MRPDRLLPGLPIYASVTSEYVRIESKVRDEAGEVTNDTGLHRVDIVPTIRFPYTKLPFLAINTTAQFRNTFWTESMLVNVVDGIETGTTTRLDAPISRRFLELTADANGPTLVRIWDAPNSTYAQRFRHSIEPFWQVLYRTAIDNFERDPETREHRSDRRKRDARTPTG